jgi:hypothetical protein
MGAPRLPLQQARRVSTGMTDAEVLAEMRRQYPYAELASHMLDGEGNVRLRCGSCRTRPVPHDWSFVMLCDPCLAERNSVIIRTD